MADSLFLCGKDWAMNRLWIFFTLLVLVSCSTGRIIPSHGLKFVKVDQNSSTQEKELSERKHPLILNAQNSDLLGSDSILRADYSDRSSEAVLGSEHEEVFKNVSLVSRHFHSWQGFQKKEIQVFKSENSVEKKYDDVIFDFLWWLIDQEPWVILLSLVVFALLIMGAYFLPELTAIIVSVVSVALVVAMIITLFMLLFSFCENFQDFWNR